MPVRTSHVSNTILSGVVEDASVCDSSLFFKCGSSLDDGWADLSGCHNTSTCQIPLQECCLQVCHNARSVEAAEDSHHQRLALHPRAGSRSHTWEMKLHESKPSPVQVLLRRSVGTVLSNMFDQPTPSINGRLTELSLCTSLSRIAATAACSLPIPHTDSTLVLPTNDPCAGAI